MLMLTHGDKGRERTIRLLMAVEQPAMFSSELRNVEKRIPDTFIKLKTQEFHGVRVRILPALCPPDAWHSAQGFVGNLRSAEAYVWDGEEGSRRTVFYNDEAQLHVYGTNVQESMPRKGQLNLEEGYVERKN